MTESHTLEHWQAANQRQAETIREQDAEIAILRTALSKVCTAISAVVQNHALTILSSRQPLTETDLQLGNTRERQDGFEGALVMVSTDYIAPLIAAHDEVAPLLVRRAEIAREALKDG
jgi:hypothetical protein